MSLEIRRLLEEAWYCGRRSAEDLKIGYATVPQLEARWRLNIDALLLTLPAKSPLTPYVCGYCGTTKIDEDGAITHYEGCSRPRADERA